MMGGDPPPPLERAVAPGAGEPALVIRDLRAAAVHGVSLQIHAREILGVAGVEGNGQRELLEAIAGLRRSSGDVLLCGREATALSVRARRRAGLAFVPEGRGAALVADFTLAENLSLGESTLSPGEALTRYGVRPAEPDSAWALSGGNQQKLLLAREMGRGFQVLLAAHPTRGLDVAAVRQVHERLLEARAQGKAVLLVSADLDELRALCDRVAVLYRGRIAGMVPAAEASDEKLGHWMTGVDAT